MRGVPAQCVCSLPGQAAASCPAQCLRSPPTGCCPAPSGGNDTTTGSAWRLNLIGRTQTSWVVPPPSAAPLIVAVVTDEVRKSACQDNVPPGFRSERGAEMHAARRLPVGTSQHTSWQRAPLALCTALTIACLTPSFAPAPACDYVAAFKAAGVDYCIAEPGSQGRKGYKKGTSCVGSSGILPQNNQ